MSDWDISDWTALVVGAISAWALQNASLGAFIAISLVAGILGLVIVRGEPAAPLVVSGETA